MLWRSIKEENEKVGTKQPRKQLTKLLSHESMDATEVTQDIFRINSNSPRGVASSYSDDKTLTVTPKNNMKLDISIDTSAQTPKSLSRTNSFKKPSTPKSVSFAIANWKRFCMTGLSESKLLSFEPLLSEQRAVFDIDMFAELSDEDQKESEFLQSYGYKFEETALIIFNRKRELVIPAPGELFRIVSDKSSPRNHNNNNRPNNNSDNTAAHASPPKPNTQYAAERHRRHQFTLATLSEEEQYCLSLLLSEQEQKFGTNMFDAMTDADEPELSSLLAQGYKYDDITHMVFQRKYEPSKPIQLVHPMQQRPQHPHSSFLRPGNHNSIHYQNQNQHQQSSVRRAASFSGQHQQLYRDNESVHSFSMNSVSMSSLNSAASPRNLFQPMVSSSSQQSAQTTPTYPAGRRASFLMDQNASSTTGFRMPMSPTYTSTTANNNNNNNNYNNSETAAAAAANDNGDNVMWSNPLRTPSFYQPNSSNASVASGSHSQQNGSYYHANNNNHNNNNYNNNSNYYSSNASVSSGTSSFANSSVTSSSHHHNNNNNNHVPSARSIAALTGEFASVDAEALAKAILAQRAAATAASHDNSAISSSSSSSSYSADHSSTNNNNNNNYHSMTFSAPNSPAANNSSKNNNNNNHNRLFRAASANFNPLATSRRTSVRPSVTGSKSLNAASLLNDSSTSNNTTSNNNSNNSSSEKEEGLSMNL